MYNILIKSIEQKMASELIKAKSAALEWHDFICWMESEKDIPCKELLNEYRKTFNTMQATFEFTTTTPDEQYERVTNDPEVLYRHVGSGSYPFLIINYKDQYMKPQAVWMNIEEKGILQDREWEQAKDIFEALDHEGIEIKRPKDQE